MLRFAPIELRIVEPNGLTHRARRVALNEPQRDELCAKAIIAAMEENGRRHRGFKAQSWPDSARVLCVILAALAFEIAAGVWFVWRLFFK